MIRIDRKRCINCGLCVKDCNSGVFQEEKDGPVVAHEEWCNRCSHCIAVCPKRAVLHEGLGDKHPRRIQRKLLQGSAYREIVKSRRSVRHYRPKPVPREVLEDIIDLARYGPTASNAQNVHYTVVTRQALLKEVSQRIFEFGDRVYRIYTRDSVQAISRRFQDLEAVRTLERYTQNWVHYREQVSKGRDLLFHNAPALLLLHTPKGQGYSRDNCVIAATNIDNYAQSLGLGACFIGILVSAMQLDRSLYGRLGVPKNHKVQVAMALGYPSIRYTYHAARKRPAVQWLSEEI